MRSMISGSSGNGTLAGSAAVSPTFRVSARRHPSGIRYGCSGVVVTERPDAKVMRRHGEMPTSTLAVIGAASTWRRSRKVSTRFIFGSLKTSAMVHDPGSWVDDLGVLVEALDQRALGVADLPDHQHVGAGDLLAVQRPGVVAERAAEDVPADVDALAAQAALGDERVGGLEVGRGDPVGWASRLGPHFRPRPKGNV